MPLALPLYVRCPFLLGLPCPFLPTSLISFSLFLSLYLFYLISFYTAIFFILFLLLGSLMGFYFQFPKLAIFCIAHSTIRAFYSFGLCFSPEVEGGGVEPPGPDLLVCPCPPPHPHSAAAPLPGTLATPLPMAQCRRPWLAAQVGEGFCLLEPCLVTRKKIIHSVSSLDG